MASEVTMRLSKPYCVVQAEERATNFPKQERLNSMRQYIARYDLFPPNSDPRTAPINMFELKALVRKWNLHHQRNFWANHRTKDDVVLALFEHKQAVDARNAKASQLKRERLARGSSMSKLDREKIKASVGIHKTPDERQTGLAMDIFGTESADFFMTTEDNMLTRSRGVGERPRGPPEGYGAGFEDDYGIDLSNAELDDVVQEAESALDGPLSPGGSHVVSRPELDPMLHVKRKVSLALLNFTLNAQIRDQFLKDGGLESLAKLSVSTHDEECVERCLACFINLLADPEYKPMELLSAGILTVVIGILKLELSDIIDACCLKILVELSTKSVCEVYLMQEGAIAECLRCLSGPHRDNKIMAAKGLVNLMENTEGPQIETLTKSLMQCVRQLSHESANDVTVIKFCASCLMSLTCLPAARAILASLGAINIIKQMAGNSNNEIIQKSTASLANLALLKSTHKEMVQLGVVIVLRELIGKGDDYIKQQCTLCLANISATADLRPLMESQGTLKSLNALAKTSRVDAILKQTALTLLNFASDAQTRKTLLESTHAGNSIDALVALLDPSRPIAVNDALCALTWLTKDQRTVDGVFLAGAVEKMKPLMKMEDARQIIALVLFNLASMPKKFQLLLDLGAIAMLLDLALDTNVEIRYYALTSLESFARDPAMHQPLFDHHIIRALGSVIELGQERSALHCSALIVHRLTTQEDNLEKVVDMQGVTLLIQLAQYGSEKDAEARATFAVVAASYYNICQRKAVMENGFLDSIIKLSKCKENNRILWISTVLFFTSTYPAGRRLLSQNRWLIPSLLNMMRSGCEGLVKIQYNSASALCNAVSATLSKNDIMSMIDEGVMNDMGIIGVLRTNSIATKQVMSKAFFNLLKREDTRLSLVKAQLAQAMVRLTKEDDKELSIFCVRMILNLSAEIEEYAKYLVEMGIHRILIALCRSTAGGAEFKRLTGNALANMSVHPDFVKPMCELTQDDERERDRAAKIVPGLLAISGVNEEGTTKDCAFILQNLCAVDRCRRNLAFDDVVQLTVKLAKMTGDLATQQLCASTLCHLSAVPHAYEDVTELAIPTLVLTMKNPSLLLAPRMDAARAIANLVVYHPKSREVCLDAGMTTAVNVLLKSTSDEGDMNCLAKILRELSKADEAPWKMLNEHATLSLVKLAHLEDAQIKLDVATTICNLAKCNFVTDIVQDGVIEAFFWLILQDALNKTKWIYLEVSIALRYLAQNNKLIKYVAMDEGRLISVLSKLASFKEKGKVQYEVQYNAAVIFYHCFRFKPAQEHLIRQGALEKVIKLADAEGDGIKDVCSATLHELPDSKLKDMDAQVLDVLMALLTIKDANFADAELFLPNRDHAATGAWSPSDGEAQYSGHCDTHEGSWPIMVIDKTMKAFKADTIEGEVLIASEWKKDVSKLEKLSQIGSMKKLTMEVTELDAAGIEEMKRKEKKKARVRASGHGKTMDDQDSESTSQSRSIDDGFNWQEEEMIDRMNGVGSGVPFLDPIESPRLPLLGAPPPTEVPPPIGSQSASNNGNKEEFQLGPLLTPSRNTQSTTAKTEEFKKGALSRSFETTTKSVPILLSPHIAGGATSSTTPSSATFGKKKKKSAKKKTPSKPTNPEEFLAARRSRQQDRVADDYATMLYAARM